jgi:hypothetical protein
MAAKIIAVLDLETVRELFAELLPLVVDLSDPQHADRFIRIDAPELVEFVAGKGIRVQTSAEVRWTVAGVGVNAKIQTARLLFSPVLAATGGRVDLHITVEDADLKNVPKLVDRGLVGAVNARLAEKRDAIGWSFARTLSLRLALPSSMEPLEQFMMDARDFAFEIDESALRVSLALPMHFSRRSP